MTVTICACNSCHLEGSRQVTGQLRRLIMEHRITDFVNLTGAFCSSKCQNGVHVSLDGREYSISPETVRSFFEKQILPRTV